MICQYSSISIQEHDYPYLGTLGLCIMSLSPYPAALDRIYMSRFGDAIRERREVVGFKTATACAEKSVQLETEDPARFRSFSQQSLSRWERDRNGDKIESAHGKSLRTLAYLLQWTSKVFEDHVGIPIGSVPDIELVAPDGTHMIFEAKAPAAGADQLARWAVNPTFEVFPVFHSVSAGTADGDPIDEREAAIPLEHMRKRGVTREETMVVLVNGDCMVSKTIWETRSIRHHDYIAIHLGAKPRENDIIVCYDVKEEKLIVKRFGEDNDDYILLYPSNGHPPIVRPKDDPELIYRGVVYWRGGNI